MHHFTDLSYHIVFGCDDNYAKYAAVTMQSIIAAIASSEHASESKLSKSNSEKTQLGGGAITQLRR